MIEATATRPLSDDERSAIEVGLDLAARLAAAERPLSVMQFQGLYDRALEQASDELVDAIGFTFGEMLRHKNPLTWIVLDDEYGSEICLEATDETLNMTVHPLSMMRHRLEDGEKVDIAELNRESVRTLNEVVAEIQPNPKGVASR